MTWTTGSLCATTTGRHVSLSWTRSYTTPKASPWTPPWGQLDHLLSLSHAHANSKSQLCAVLKRANFSTTSYNGAERLKWGLDIGVIEHRCFVCTVVVAVCWLHRFECNSVFFLRRLCLQPDIFQPNSWKCVFICGAHLSGKNEQRENERVFIYSHLKLGAPCILFILLDILGCTGGGKIQWGEKLNNGDITAETLPFVRLLNKWPWFSPKSHSLCLL